MKGPWLACLALGALIGPLSRVRADVIPLEGIVSLVADAQVNPDPLQYDQTTLTQEFAIDEMSDTGFAGDYIENGFAEALTAVSAVWSDAGHGEVQFLQIGFQTDINEAGGSASLNGTAWSYRFQTGNETEIVLDYAITLDPETTDPSGLDGFSFVVSQDGNQIFSQSFGVESFGEIIVSLDPNAEYTISIAVMAEVSGDVGSRTAFMNGDFVWGIGAGK